MSWIKIATTLPRNPKILLLADALQCSHYAALGFAVDWLTWLDGVTEDGKTLLTPDQINALFPVTFFCDRCHKDVTHVVTALAKIGWIYVDENGHVCASDFDVHNGENAKRRFANAERQRKSRSARKGNLSQKNVTPVTKKRDQRREEKNIYSKADNKVSLNTTVDVAAAPQPGRAQSADQVLTYIAALPHSLRGDEVATCAYAFFDEMEAVGWTRRGTPIADWRAAARAYVGKWALNSRSGGQRAVVQKPVTYRSEQEKNYEL